MSRIGAIIRTDVLIRLRRPSTVVVFLLLSAFAYLWVPDPATGRTLLVIENQRAVYNSAALGMATAMIGTIFIGLAGFYFLSNTLRRDVSSRCGFVIASTTMGSSEYLFGKFAGNVLFLTTFMIGFMATAMVMLLVRGEAPLQPLIFITQYVLLVPPTIMFVSALAITFESVPWLSGKLGDVVYFFLWVGSLGVVASTIKSHDPGLAGYFDFSGFGFLMVAMNTDQMSIGSTTFDPAKGLHVFTGLHVPPEWVLPRIVATILPAALILVAMLFFHRFDPARIKRSSEKGSRNWIGRASMLVKPLVRRFYALASAGSTGSLFSAARQDALMALTAFPLSLLVIAGFAIAGLAAKPADLLPIAFAAAALLIADVAPREKRAGTLAIVYSTPLLKSRFVLWKFTTALLLMAPVLIVPGVRLGIARCAAIVPFLIGVLCVAAVATALGVISANPKTFIVVFLTFWYGLMSDHGKTAAFDFAGFFGIATPSVTVAYAGLALASLIAAQLFHSVQLRRSW